MQVLAKPFPDLRTCFNKNDQAVIFAIADVAFNNVPKDDSFNRVSKLYNADEEILRTETKIYTSYEKERTATTHNSAEVWQKVFGTTNFVWLPESYRTVSNLATFHAISCSADRSFSELRQLKNVFSFNNWARKTKQHWSNNYLKVILHSNV